jgi:hypothetical protein
LGARFDPTLEFQASGELEVCGPVDFDPGDVMFEVVSFSITDGKGVTVHQLCAPHVRAAPGEMWETDLPKVKAKRLSPGPNASGQGFGIMHLGNGGVVPFPWTQTGIGLV